MKKSSVVKIAIGMLKGKGKEKETVLLKYLSWAGNLPHSMLHFHGSALVSHLI